MSWGQVDKVGKEKHSKKIPKSIQYGTAGFRTRGELLDHVMYRMGVLAVLRSKFKEATIGVMITASHNPEEDNGVKLVDPMGEMLEQSWEGIATKLANAADNELVNVINEIVKENEIDLNSPSNVVVGRDTRKSSPPLAQAVFDGILAAGGIYEDYGIVSTPQLHYFVVCINTENGYGEPNEQGYYKKLSAAFNDLLGKETKNGNYNPVLKFDGANGVGASKMKDMAVFLKDFEIDIHNDGKGHEDVLNFGCGADFVKVQQKFPRKFDEVGAGVRCVSVDGDADRVVYFYADGDRVFHLMDGDRIATLVAGYLKELVSKIPGLELNLGCVQTAYANGASTDYIEKELKVPVACVPTGVKHLHHKALEFDIGVYFEANGHGTVVFSDETQLKITEMAEKSNSINAQKLSMTMEVINQTVGDAISDMMLVESILHAKGWSIEDWAASYVDLPNRQTKVRVADRNVITTTDAERKCVTPDGLQIKINEIVAKFERGRSFVRPSGTEDVVRVYAEATTREQADQLAYEVGLAVHELAGGVGSPPAKCS